jgi:hypothetical protein
MKREMHLRAHYQHYRKVGPSLVICSLLLRSVSYNMGNLVVRRVRHRNWMYQLRFKKVVECNDSIVVYLAQNAEGRLMGLKEDTGDTDVGSSETIIK